MSTDPSIKVIDNDHGALSPGVARKVAALAQKWANDPGNAPSPKEAFVELVGAGVEFSPGIDKVSLHPYQADTVRMILPMPGQIERVLGSFAEQSTLDNYKLPQPFVDVVNILQTPRSLTKLEAEEFYLFRLGDYILQHCM